MSKPQYPIIGEINWRNIIQKCCYDFSLTRETLADKFYFRDARSIRARASGKTPINDNDLHNLFQLIRKESGGTSESFVNQIVEWYPSLSKYRSESEIKAIISANLIGSTNFDSSIQNPTSDRLSSIDFLQSCLNGESKVTFVKMAYQTGWLWFDDRKRTDLLIHISESGIPIQVIANPESVIKDIANTMSDPDLLLRYIGFNETLKTWHKYECTYNNIHLRISNYPIIRKSLIVEFEDGSSKAIFGDYAYGSPSKVAPPYTMVTNTDASFAFYNNEFDFLWDKATSFSDWQSSLPKPEETMQPNDYILLYPSHERASDNHSDWIYSDLSIGENNEVKLHVNISDLNGLPDANNNLFEYEYNGKLTLTGKHLFISLYDDARQENINLTLFHRCPDNSRFLGIMTGLSPLGQPVAFKCACIGRSAISKTNFQLLRDILCRQTEDWNNTLMILEQQDINLFYSQKIYSMNSSEKTYSSL